MKTFVYVILSMIVTFSLYSCESAHYVSARPNEIISNRPIAPGAGYTWVDGDYYWHGGRYRYRNGYWARPRPGHIWHGGSWNHGSGGYYWRRGRWN